MRSLKFGQRLFILSLIVFGSIAGRTNVSAQVRGVYPLGMSAMNSGVTPESGFSYSNMLLIYSRNRRTDAEGKTIATGLHTVVMDMNSFIWVSRKKILGGARFSASATLPVAKTLWTQTRWDPSAVVTGWPIRITSLSFWAGIQNARRFGWSMAFWRRQADSTRLPMITSGQVTGPMRFRQARRFFSLKTKPLLCRPFRCTRSTPVRKRRMTSQVTLSISIIH